MSKGKSVFLYWLSAVILGAGVFAFAVMRAKAAEVTGSEAFFTHAHAGSCYQSVTETCSGSHTYSHGTEYGTYHCTKCGTMTQHLVEADTYRCPVNGSTWQQNGKASCVNCGTVHSAWNSEAPGNHIFTRQKQICGMAEGEPTAGIWIVADDRWTNSGVNLSVKCDILKQDLINGNISYDWPGGSLYVTENGVYSVNAVNGAGKTVTASIGISCIDKIAPVIESVDGDTAGMSKSRITVTVRASDGESGLADAAFSTDGGATWSGNAGFAVEEGADVLLAVRDRAGNSTSRTVKRSDFPYPSEPAPAPQPEKPAASGSQGGDAGQGGSAGQEGNATDTVTENPGKEHNISGTAAKAQADGGTVQNIAGDKKKGSEDQAGAKQVSTNKGYVEKGERKKETAGSGGTGLQPAGGGITVVRRTETGQNTRKDAEETADRSALQTADGADMQRETAPEGSIMAWMAGVGRYLIANRGMIAGIGLSGAGIFLLFYLLWLYSVELYCYDGGEEYRRLGILRLKKEKDALSLFLPDYLTETAGSPRYRLTLRSRLVKKYGKKDLIVYNEEHKLRQPLEECVDFVL